MRHKSIGDERGRLVALEAGTDVPFDIKRVFFIYGNESNLPRGKHAHLKTRQYLISVSGSCRVTLDDGINVETHELCSPDVGLFQDALVWGSMHDFSMDCVLLVLASEHYDAEDYLIDYDEFLKAAGR